MHVAVRVLHSSAFIVYCGLITVAQFSSIGRPAALTLTATLDSVGS